jgi:hypothetical protein
MLGIDADKLADQLDDIQEDVSRTVQVVVLILVSRWLSEQMQSLEEVTDMLSTPMLGQQFDEVITLSTTMAQPVSASLLSILSIHACL